jgi:hypothetical protein
MSLYSKNAEVSGAKMNQEKVPAKRAPEDTGEDPGKAIVEETAEAAFSGYEVKFSRLVLIYIG